MKLLDVFYTVLTCIRKDAGEPDHHGQHRQKGTGVHRTGSVRRVVTDRLSPAAWEGGGGGGGEEEGRDCPGPPSCVRKRSNQAACTWRLAKKSGRQSSGTHHPSVCCNELVVLEERMMNITSRLSGVGGGGPALGNHAVAAAVRPNERAGISYSSSPLPAAMDHACELVDEFSFCVIGTTALYLVAAESRRLVLCSSGDMMLQAADCCTDPYRCRSWEVTLHSTQERAGGMECVPRYVVL